ncbi:tape measure protein [Shinella sp. DD12]|uniref:tape measure protein n=1 Tax=Shinella sp. DD12 TaxID=1410620 RepID=UPI000437BE7F|nr:tape measure protein [Shinella sp. DD12]EYR81381.1 putative tail protein [Shinella sp. DD12]
MIVDELVAILGYEMRGQDKLRAFTQSIDDAARRLATFAVAAATVAAGAAAALGKSVIDTTAKFESFQATLETVEGSAEKARASLDWISEFAKRTPYEVEELTSAFVKLRAYGMDPTNGLMEDLGNASSAMGKSLIDAVEMIADASTGEFERLKEFGIRASQAGNQVTFSWTENGKTLTKTVKKNGEEITKFIQERFGARFNGAMMRQSKTWNGMMSNLSDTWTDFQRKIGEAGFFDAVKGQLGRVLDFLAQLELDGTLARWAKSWSSAFIYITDAIARFGWRLAAHWGTIAELIEEHKGVWEGLKWVLLGIGVRLFPLISLFGALALAIDDWLTFMRGGESVIGDFADALSEMLGADPDAVASAITTIGTAALGLAGAAAVMGSFTAAVWPLAAALAAFAGAFYLAKSGFDYLASLDAEGSKIKAVENPRSKPGYVEKGHGYDDKGEFIYMDGNRRVDRPDENPAAGFTKDALDYKFLLQNLEENRAKMEGDAAAANVSNTLNDSRNQSTTVNVGGVTVQGVQNVTGAVGGAVGNAVGQAAARAGASRFEKDDQL